MKRIKYQKRCTLTFMQEETVQYWQLYKSEIHHSRRWKDNARRVPESLSVVTYTG